VFKLSDLFTDRWVLDRSLPKTIYNKFAYIPVLAFILGVSLAVRCGGLSERWQNLATIGLGFLTLILGIAFALLDKDRCSIHKYFSPRAGVSKGRYPENMGWVEQKCYQFMYIFFVITCVLCLDKWHPFLGALGEKVIPLIRHWFLR
jgi:hypothetical protein